VKVDAFQSAVVEGWREHRVLPDLVTRCELRVRTVSSQAWVGDRFRFEPRLDPKALFVTPTNWVGLEDNGRERGRHLAQGEVSAVIRLVAKEASGAEATGDAPQRLARLLVELRADGFEPSLIVLPIDWRLVQSLGLGDSWEAREEGGL